MKIRGVPFRRIDWNAIEAETMPGETAAARVKSVMAGDIQSRVVSYESDYCADHWCEKGHILFMIDGELILEFKNGEAVTLRAGQGFQVGDDGEPHRVRTECAATAFIVD